jgi:cysteine desulfurase
MKLPVYLDNHATTPVDPRVFEAMKPYFLEKFGNAASASHAFGREARQAVERARAQVAASIGAQPEEIAFTSGGTESDNLAIKGAAWMLRERGDHLITSVTEHKAVLDACHRLEGEGFRVTFLPVDRYGQVAPDDVARAITPSTILVSLMAANNEVGTLHPVAEIGRICRDRGVLFHCDATQAIGRIPFDVHALNIDLAAFTAHKFYGPKGAGALFARKGLQLVPILDGGGHERGLRSGTLNVPGIVGLGAACELAQAELAEDSRRILELRRRLETRLVALGDVAVNGHPTERLAGNLNVSFPGVDGQALMMGLSGIAVSSSAACNTEKRAASHVLTAMGVSEDLAERTLRFGIGRFNSAEEIEYAADQVVETVSQLRAFAEI